MSDHNKTLILICRVYLITSKQIIGSCLTVYPYTSEHFVGIHPKRFHFDFEKITVSKIHPFYILNAARNAFCHGVESLKWA